MRAFILLLVISSTVNAATSATALKEQPRPKFSLAACILNAEIEYKIKGDDAYRVCVELEKLKRIFSKRG
jgi:hypothetical protein